MKKFYTIALAALFTLSAAAVTPQITPEVKGPKELKTLPVSNINKPRKLNVLSMQKVANLDGSQLSTKDTYTLEGTYTMTIGDYLADYDIYDITVTLTMFENNIIDIEEVSTDVFMTDIPGIYDNATGMIYFIPLELKPVEAQVGLQKITLYPKLIPFEYNWDTGNLDEQEMLGAMFNSSTGQIRFPEDTGFAWPGFEKADYSGEPYGYFGAFDVLALSQKGNGGGTVNPNPNPTDDEEEADQWTTVGIATMTEAYATPIFSTGGVRLNPDEHPFDVTLQRNNKNPNIYRVWKPFTSASYHLLGQNSSKFQGQMVFDLTDRDHVIVKPGYAAGLNVGQGEMYCFGMLGWQIHGFGSDYDPALHFDAIIAFMKEKNQAFDTYNTQTGVLTINASVFDIEPACENPYTWQNNPYETSTITFPEDVNAAIAGVESAVIDIDNAPVEYFNLQGVRVDNPTAGQLVIKKQGTNVSKQIVR